WLPFAVWRSIVFVRRPSRGTAILAGIGLAAVALSSSYFIPYFLIPFASLFAVYWLLSDRRWFANVRNLRLSAVVVAVFAVLTVPAVIPFLTTDAEFKAQLSAVASETTEKASADILDYALPDPANPFVGHLVTPIHNPAGRVENPL